MQVARLVQAVVLMMILAMAASCTASREYAQKLFSSPHTLTKDSQLTATRFLNLETLEASKENWVTTAIMNGNDTTKNSIALDKLSKQIPIAKIETKDTLTIKKTELNIPVDKTSVTVNGTRQKRVQDD